MKKYTRKDFLALPDGIIYSKMPNHEDLLYGLFCKTRTIGNPRIDWDEQDLIGSMSWPNDIVNGLDAVAIEQFKRDSFYEFRTDLNRPSRDGMYEESDCFIVWDKQDISQLVDYLNDALLAY